MIEEYNIKTAEDIQEALKDLLGGTIQEMMEAELDEHLGYEEYNRENVFKEENKYENGYYSEVIDVSKGIWSVNTGC